VKRQDRVAGHPREKDGACLGDMRRPTRTVDSEGDRLPMRQVAPQLHQRAGATPRRRAPGRAITESRDDPRDPLAVEVLARDDDDPFVFPEERGGQDAPVPEREDRLAAGRDDCLIVLQAVDSPAIGGAERPNEGSGCRRDQRSFANLPGRQSQLNGQITKLPDFQISRFPNAATCLRNGARRRLRAGPSR
jgi:hypothetical protein